MGSISCSQIILIFQQRKFSGCHKQQDSQIDEFGDISTNYYDILSQGNAMELYHTVLAHEIFVDAITLAPQVLKHHLPDLDLLCPNFGWIRKNHIQATLDKTSQFYHGVKHCPFWKHFKLRFPSVNVWHLNEEYATDTLFMDVPAHDDGVGGHAGCTMAQ